MCNKYCTVYGNLTRINKLWWRWTKKKLHVYIYIYFRLFSRAQIRFSCLLVWSIFFIRALADTRQMGKLSKDQFALAMYLIQQKVSKGIDPPQVLPPDMIPPTDRNTPIQVNQSFVVGDTELTCFKSHGLWVWILYDKESPIFFLLSSYEILLTFQNITNFLTTTKTLSKEKCSKIFHKPRSNNAGKNLA